jgi:protein-tyrosine phosphatase
MKPGLVFITFAAAFAIGAVSFTPWTLPLFWPCASLALVGTAHFGAGAGVFGKRPDGSLAASSVVMLLPYLGYLRLRSKVIRNIRPEDPYNQLLPEIYIGRRLATSEYPPDVSFVVDLTCEFDEPQAVRRLGSYRSLPILDGSTPPMQAALGLVAEIKGHNGGVYIHCARGHGRTGTMAAFLLLAKGVAPHPEAAISLVRSVRPGAKLKPVQYEFLLKAHEMLRPVRP